MTNQDKWFYGPAWVLNRIFHGLLNPKPQNAPTFAEFIQEKNGWLKFIAILTWFLIIWNLFALMG